MLIPLLIAAFLLDALKSYLKLCVRRTAAQGYPPEMGLPLAFMRAHRDGIRSVIGSRFGIVGLQHLSSWIYRRDWLPDDPVGRREACGQSTGFICTGFNCETTMTYPT